MEPITANQVRQFLVQYFAKQLLQRGFKPESIPDAFDFLAEGIIDSLGVLEMMTAVEREIGFEIDMTSLDAESLTVLGPFCAHIERAAIARSKSPCKENAR